jgi:hypothetical protein
MGCDIHPHAEVRDPTTGKWTEASASFIEGPNPFDWRSYSVFAFLAGVRNYSKVSGIVVEPRGLPEDSPFHESQCKQEESPAWGRRYEPVSEAYNGDYHSHSYVTLAELLAFNYDATFTDRRNNGSTISDGQVTTYRDYLLSGFSVRSMFSKPSAIQRTCGSCSGLTTD